MKPVYAVAAAAAALAFASPSNAELYDFSLTGDYTASWTLDSSPAPDDFGPGGFIVWDVEGFPDALLGVADLTFYTAASSGGLTIDDFYGAVTLVDSTGSQLFSGATDSPTFLLGSFDLFEFGGDGEYTLVISDAAAVPEPAVWAMMIAGFGLVGGAMRRRAREVSVEVAYA